MVRWCFQDRREVFVTGNVAPSSERGATMIEYVLLAACITMLCVTSVSYAGQETRDTFDKASRAIAATNAPETVVPPPVIP